MSLVAFLLPWVGAGTAVAAPAAPRQTATDPVQMTALEAKVATEAGRIHQLTEQLDQARLQVNSTSARLVGVTHQHQVAVQGLDANRAVLLEQALRAYMHGGVTAARAEGNPASADLTVGREYLRVASGDLAETGDQLRQLEASLRADQAMLQGAQQANLQAAVQLKALRDHALSVAASEQVQLTNLQVQLTAQSAAAAAAAAATTAGAGAGGGGSTVTGLVRRSGSTQGLPVNNGLISVIQQAAGPPAPPAGSPPTPVTVATTPPPSTSGGSTGGGGHAGGVWLSLRRCESSDNYSENTGNGFYGAYQFSPSTWSGLGYPGRPDLESPAMQDDAAMKLQAQAGWGQWPACSAALGLS